MNKKLLLTVIAFAVLASATAVNLRAETMAIYDEDFSIVSGPTSASILGARWGLWDGTSFVQAVTSGNLGYVDLTASEMDITLNQINNSIYAVGTQMAVAIYGNDGTADSQTVSFTTASGLSGFKYAILTDPSWLAPAFANNANFVSFSFTANTTALGGSGYSFNGGNEQITMVPEPSTYALLTLGGLALAGHVIRRRRRS